MNKLSIYVLTISIFFGLVIFTNCKRDNVINVYDFDILPSDIENVNLAKFSREHSFSINYHHHNFRLLNHELIYSVFSVDMQSLYVYNATIDSLVEHLLFDKQITNNPILDIYLHTYDSIFVMYKNEDSESKNEVVLTLFDSNLNIKNKYPLNDIKYLFADESPSLIENNILNYQNRILENKLLLSLAVYSPETHENSFKDFHPKQLFFIDLKTGVVKPLDAKFPALDIGKKFMPKILTNTIQYYILNNDSIIFSYPHSPNLYLLNTKKNVSKELKTFTDFPFENKFGLIEDDSILSYSYKELILSSKLNLYFRRIVVNDFNGRERTSVVQILDRNFVHKGFLVGNTSKWFFSCFGDDVFVLSRENNTLQPISLNQPIMYERDIFVRDFIINNNEEKKPIQSWSKETAVNDRFDLYIRKLGLTESSHIIMVNTDFLCSNCVDYLMRKLKDNEQYYLSNNINYIFIGNETVMAKNLLSNYSIQTNIMYDIDAVYKSYFLDSEIEKYILSSKKQDGGYHVEKLSFDILMIKMENIIKEKE